MSTQEKTFTLEDLQKYNGQDGNPTYFACNGVVYDVSGSKLWKNGKHMNRHQSGSDLSEDIKNAPHPVEVLERYPRVGVLEGGAKAPASGDSGPKVPAIVKRFPFLKRHPHPMTVHFPIVFSITAACFTLLYLIIGWKGFDQAALCALGGNVFFTPVAILTGYYTWWLNYGSAVTRETVMKISLPPVLLGLSIWLFVWRLETPDILDRATGDNWLYILLVLLLFPLVGLIGWFGANLTFPLHHE